MGRYESEKANSYQTDALADGAARHSLGRQAALFRAIIGARFYGLQARLGICVAFINRVSRQCYCSSISGRPLIDDGAFLRCKIAHYIELVGQCGRCNDCDEKECKSQPRLLSWQASGLIDNLNAANLNAADRPSVPLTG